MKRVSHEVSPATLLADELAFLRKTIRDTVRALESRLDGEVSALTEAVVEQSKGAKISAAKLRDMRDMLTLVRMLEVRPEKGRRRDLKRFEVLLGELRDFVDHW